MSRHRPERVFDPGLQHERTGLAWERTAVAMMVAGVLLTRYAAQDASPVIALAGIAQTVAGAVVLVWAGMHYDELHGPLRQGAAIVRPGATRLVGTGTVAFTAVALVLAILVSVRS